MPTWLRTVLNYSRGRVVGGQDGGIDDEVLTPDFHVFVLCAWQLAFFLHHLLIIPMQVPDFLRLHSTL